MQNVKPLDESGWKSLGELWAYVNYVLVHGAASPSNGKMGICATKSAERAAANGKQGISSGAASTVTSSVVITRVGARVPGRTEADEAS